MFKSLKNFLGNFVRRPLFCVTGNHIDCQHFPLCFALQLQHGTHLTQCYIAYVIHSNVSMLVISSSLLSLPLWCCFATHFPQFASILRRSYCLYQIQTSVLAVCPDGIKPSSLWPSSVSLAMGMTIEGDVRKTVLVHPVHLTKQTAIVLFTMQIYKQQPVRIFSFLSQVTFMRTSSLTAEIKIITVRFVENRHNTHEHKGTA